jgi:hypothetical protein
MQFLVILAILLVVVLFVSTPLRRAARATGREAQPGGDAFDASVRERAELEAARESKYREIRDAELDHHTGKLSDEDYEAVDESLRAEAIEILRALDKVEGADTAA